jgi:hypothetical protein
MKKQLFFNEADRLKLDDVKFTEEELKVALDAATELGKLTSAMNDAGKKSMRQTWRDEAKIAREIAETMGVFCNKNGPTDTEEYVAIKETLTKALILDGAADYIDEVLARKKEKETTPTLDRLPGETAAEHRARLLAYLSEDE